MERLLNKELEEKIRTLPKDPGVYLMKDRGGNVIYVGKARNLSNRVRQYFGALSGKQAKVAAMVQHIHTFDYIIADSEKEALILECNLIKKYQPYYNILLRDDKHFPYVRIDLKQDYPRIEIVRKVERDGAKYFGPYLAAHSIRDLMDAVYKLFPLRSCKKDIQLPPRKNARPCLNYQMGRCAGPCCGLVSKEEYAKTVKEVIDLLSGKYKALEAELKKQMEEAAEKLDFERAASLRDKIVILKKVAERQKAGFPDLNDKDLFAAAMGEREAIVQAFFVRKGKLSEAQRFTMSEGSSEAEVLDSFLKLYYMDKTAIPKKIYVGAELEDTALLEEWLSDIRGSKVEIVRPQRGDNKKLVDMARRNALEALKRKEQSAKRDYERTVGAAKGLGDILGTGYIRRMECYDISNTQGTDSVASMVVFTDGKPDKKEYRRFRIKTVEGANDFASMAEVLTRRLLRGFAATDKEHGFGAVPDLIIVDGGKGQLSSAVSVLESLGLEDMNIVGLAKREEEIFLPGESEPIVLAKNAPELRLITAIRDEAHRFAITYHRALRQNRTLASELDRIAGVGNKRKLLLLEAFGDLEGIRGASVEELSAVKGVDIRTARAVYQYFHE